ncbi:MAG TPA: alpha/beta fold hydrolase [Longimicrobium sp.]|nr:alpha/beta fold hydrolase [Longimicrobium sp.]
MKFSASFLVLPLLAAAACDRAADPLSSSATTRHVAELAAAPAVREGYVTGAGGVQLFYHVEGSGPDTTVMVSGGPGLSYRYMQPDLGALTRGRTMIYFDQRGSGNSTIIHDPAQLTPALQVADIEAVRQHFGIDRMQLAGHSAGANFAALYAAAYPQHVERLLLLDPGAASGFYAAEFAQRRFERTDPAQFNQQLAWIGAFLGGQVPDAEAVQTCEALFTSVFTPYFADPANLAARQGRFCDEPVAQAQNAVFTLLTGLAAFDGAWDAAPVGAQITAPTLVVYGDADVLSLGNAQHWASSIAGSRFEVIQGAGHFPWLEKPAQFNAIVNTFLRRSDVLN